MAGARLETAASDRKRTVAACQTDLCLGSNERCVTLAGEYKLIQRLRGHRFSVDDMLVAHLAVARAPEPRAVLDLGCGIGSVLLIVGWVHRSAKLVGLEAQAESAALARRNLILNGCQARGAIVEGDLRDEALVDSLGSFDLVTGSPPYFDPRATTVAADPQRAYARWEMRGGIEEYARAAFGALRPGGLFVTCASADLGRATRALETAGFVIASKQRVIPRDGKAPYLTLLIGARGRNDPATPEERPPLVLCARDGSLSSQHVAMRDWLGISRVRGKAPARGGR